MSGRRKQSYCDSYAETFTFIKKSTKGEHHAYCKSCNCDISISAGGATCIARGCSGDLHYDRPRNLPSRKGRLTDEMKLRKRASGANDIKRHMNNDKHSHRSRGKINYTYLFCSLLFNV